MTQQFFVFFFLVTLTFDLWVVRIGLKWAMSMGKWAWS